MVAAREWFEKDYYKLLGVAVDATAKEVTAAYRKLARQSHPGLLRLIEQSFGAEWLEQRVRETAEPRTRKPATEVAAAATGSED